MNSELSEIFQNNGITRFTIVDVGAKGRIEFPEVVSEMCDIHAFEPNPIEYKILVDLYKQNNFRSLTLNQTGLTEKKGTSDFIITNNASMSSFLEADIDNYKKHFGSYNEYSSWENNISLQKKITIETETLAEYFSNKLTIDYLKIDTQGSELLILKGAEQLLQEQRINIIKTEVSSISVYKNQALFSDIDIYLRKHNYTLVDFITYKNSDHSLFSKQTWHHAPCGDAIYVSDKFPENNSDAIKKGLILSWLGYKGIAKSLLDSSELNANETKIILSISSQTKVPFLKTLIKNITPPVFYDFAKYLWRIKK